MVKAIMSRMIPKSGSQHMLSMRKRATSMLPRGLSPVAPRNDVPSKLTAQYRLDREHSSVPLAAGHLDVQHLGSQLVSNMVLMSWSLQREAVVSYVAAID